MFPSLEQKLDRYEVLEKMLTDPEILANIDRMLEIQKEMGGLAKIAAAVREHRVLCLLYTSPSPRDQRGSRMPSSA